MLQSRPAGSRLSTCAALLTLASLFLPGCGDTSRPAGPRDSDAGSLQVGFDAGGVPSTDGGKPSTAEDLPCEVAEVLAARCWTCHGAMPAGGAPMSLVSHAHLTSPSTVDPSLSFAERAVLRMRATTAPMPPSGPRVPDADIARIDAWIAGGMPAGSCDPADPFDTPVQCTSERTWRGDEGPEMHPGRACITCHTSEDEGPDLWLGGTVYPSAHEPDDCIGAGDVGDVVVEITDADGQVFELVPNASGNFLLVHDDEPDDFEAPFTATFAYPYRARVLFEGRERAMSTAQTTGDCNSCHTVAGANGAPGRILLP